MKERIFFYGSGHTEAAFKFCEEGRGSRWPNDNDGEEITVGDTGESITSCRVVPLSRGVVRRSREARAVQGHAGPREHEMPDTGSLSR